MVVEAPSGYGKTTLMQDFFLKMLPENTVWIRHVCTEESPRAAWRRFCFSLRNIDAAAGEALLRLGLPDEDTLGDAETLLREMECPVPTWLAVDDFHHIAGLAPPSLWSALLEHDAPHLHAALVTRPLARSVAPCEKSGLLFLGNDDLRLTERECGEYFAVAGFSLTEDQTRELFRRTGGWIIALALHLRRYRESGAFAQASDLDGLLRDVVWNTLDDAARDALLRCSPFDAFTAGQAAFLAEMPELPANVITHLRRNTFFRFEAASGLYYPHSALLEFLRGEFAALPERTQRETLYRAGDWCAANGERGKAVAFYYRLRDFEKILALDLSGLEDNRLMDMPDRAYADALRDIVAHCGPDMKLRHPLSMIQLAFEFFGQGCLEDFAALCAEMAEIAGQDVLPETERNRLRGELLLMEAFSRYNSITEMGERMRRAAALTGGATSLISPHNSWTFGNVSVLLMYHRDAGCLDRELADMETYTPYYVALARGHGSGGPALMRAEALLCRGETDAAEIHGHKARTEAELHGQISVLIGVALFFGRLAILRGDGAAFASALADTTRLAEECPQKSNRMAADMARAFLMGILERPQDMAGWLREGPPSAFGRRLFTQAAPCAHICRARCLLLEGKAAMLLGEADAALALAEALHSSLALLYGHIHIAAARNMLGGREGALTALRKALDLALPDRLLLPLAECYSLIGPLLESLRPDALTDIRALAARLEAGRAAVPRGTSTAHPPFGLSRRELTTALLAAEGFSNQEIAEKIHVTVNTVKAHLKSAYKKCGARNRLTLHKLFQNRQDNFTDNYPKG
jgi:LuxR family maltose regulon positive regulatory protein